MTYYSALHYAAKAEAAATTATTLFPYLTDITTVANNIASVNTVSADISSIITAATNIASINTVATSISDISAVVSNAANINTVATNISNVNTVATNISNVNNIAGDLTNIDAVNANKTNIDAVAGNETNINAVNENKTNIDAVAGDITNVNAVASDLTNINAVAADLTNIDNASQYAAEAKQWAIGDPSEPVDGSAKYWAQQAAGQVIPSQTGHSGEFLTTDGTALSWDSVDALPDQTGQSGKFLTTDGTDASWANVDALPSQTGQSGKYLTTDGSSASWATVSTTPSIDNKSITTNGSSQLQTVGVINQNDTTTAIKTWTGTKAQYDAIVTKDANTLYNITDDTDVSLTILEALYPVGSIYITTANTCPLSTLIAGSTWSLVSSGIVTAGDIPCKGNGMALGLTNGTTNSAISFSGSAPYPTLYTGNYGSNVGQAPSGNLQYNYYTTGVTTDSTKSGIIADTTSLTLAVNIFERTN